MKITINRYNIHDPLKCRCSIIDSVLYDSYVVNILLADKENNKSMREVYGTTCDESIMKLLEIVPLASSASH